MRYCKKCLVPDTRPSIKFDEYGVCPPCNYVENISKIDWVARKKQLLEIISSYKNLNRSKNYDCLIGVSGGKDSTRQAMYVKNDLGLRPLLVSCVQPPQHQTELGADNLANLISLGFDTISVGPSPIVWKRLMWEGFIKYGNWHKSTEMALFASVPRVAIAYQIPLILWGENPALHLGNLKVGMTWDGNKMRNSNTIASGPESLAYPGISQQQLYWYKYPSEDEMSRAEIQLVYLGYFWKDWSKINNANYSIAYGLNVRDDSSENMGSLEPFDSLDDDFVLINQMLKHMKFGFGKVTEEVSELIRAKKLTRDEGIQLVKKYDGKCGEKYIRKFCQYMDITLEVFWEIAEKYRNMDIWVKSKNEYRLKYPVG